MHLLEPIPQKVAVFRYELTVTVKNIDEADNIRYTTYGVSAFDMDQNLILQYPDVSTDQALVKCLVRDCNLHQLDVIHLEDVILDRIG